MEWNDGTRHDKGKRKYLSIISAGSRVMFTTATGRMV